MAADYNIHLSNNNAENLSNLSRSKSLYRTNKNEKSNGILSKYIYIYIDTVNINDATNESN